MTLSIVYIVTSIIQVSLQKNDDIFVIMQLAYSLIVILMFVKFLFFMRIFTGFGFLVSMLKEVIIDLKTFLAFFLIVLFTFGLIFKILGQNLETYGGLG